MEFVGGWQPIAVAAATLSLLFAAAVFVAGTVFDSRHLRVWAKAEFVQAVVSALFVGLLLSASLGIQAFSSELSGGKEPIEFAQEHLEEANARMELASGAVTVFLMVLSALRETEVSLEISPLGVSTEPLAGLAAVTNDAEFVLGALSFTQLANWVQQVLLVFISATMMYYFLPVGVVLRSLPITRPVGAFMMALSVGLFFVFPLVFVFNAAALAKTNALIDSDISELMRFNEQFPISSFNFLDVAALSAFVVSMVSNAVWNVALSALAELSKLVAGLILQVVFFPLFNLVVVFLFTRSLYRALNSEVVLWS